MLDRGDNEGVCLFDILCIDRILATFSDSPEKRPFTLRLMFHVVLNSAFVSLSKYFL